MPSTIGYITFDCEEPGTLATFWSQVLDYDQEGAERDWALIRDPSGTDTPILFQRVPEGKVAKNRVHLDLMTDDLAAEVERLVGLGARTAEGFKHSESSMVMADPEGNEFCVARP